MDSKYQPVPVQLIEQFQLKSIDPKDYLCIIDRNVPNELKERFEKLRSIDRSFDENVSLFDYGEHSIIYSGIGQLTDYDDCRTYSEAAGKAISRAIKAGAKSIVILVADIPDTDRYYHAKLATILGALHELYIPIQLREDVPEIARRIDSLKIYLPNGRPLLTDAINYERALFVARDIGGGDPERMTPIRVADYVRQLFDKTQVTVSIIDNLSEIRTKYPLYEAVNRAASSVDRHRGRIIYLEYKPPQAAVKSLLLVGKGVTYDTGGADVKAGGVMAGMSRDKCGAAAVAGFMKYVADTRPTDVHVIAVMCMVRNSIGEECYVSDEVITSRYGVRVRVGNTDAEGRMCMADALCHMRELALNLPDPHLYTIATLTGHACLAVGEGYSICIDNGPARRDGHSKRLKEIGDLVGQPFELSTMRKEDFAFHKGVVLGEDVVQCNNLPSSRTPRGHQTPAAFMMMASGLDKHGCDSDKPLKYSHLDIAASAGEYPKKPTGAPIIALAKTHFSIFVKDIRHKH